MHDGGRIEAESTMATSATSLTSWGAATTTSAMRRSQHVHIPALPAPTMLGAHDEVLLAVADESQLGGEDAMGLILDRLNAAIAALQDVLDPGQG